MIADVEPARRWRKAAQNIEDTTLTRHTRVRLAAMAGHIDVKAAKLGVMGAWRRLWKENLSD